ncbi:hypothetical protein ACQKCU_24015 [Heyndrickxia sporothermodurans]
MQDPLRSLELAIMNLESQIQLHKSVSERNTDHYNNSFKNGQRLIFKDFFPAIEIVKVELEKLKGEKINDQNNKAS